jgi:hypothetical protein
MSLEAAQFIKALVATNPEGTDPESQGDDHLRMIKEVLKTQFSGFTDGTALLMTETNLNRLARPAENTSPQNLDVAAPYTCVIGVVAGTTGALPPGMQNGDAVLNINFNANSIFQLAFLHATKSVWWRDYLSGAWSPWNGVSSFGIGQTWQAPSRAFNTLYTNATDSPITVSVSGIGAANAQIYMSGDVNGNIMQRCQVTEFNGTAYTGFYNNLTLIVPPGSTYGVAISAATTLVAWWELR